MATSNHHLLHSMPPWPMPTDRRWRGSANHPAPNCPRCASPQTKFCYYNNYSLSQPRYFCKGCRRYWTKGGSLRNVPVGGGCRKTRRSRSNKSGSSHPGLGPRPTLDSSSCESGGPNIDMALVFSNFLNQQDDHKHLIQEEDHQGFISPELSTFDHIIEDVFWPDESNLFGSQLQDFDSPLLGDNWSFFDTTGFEAFSKP